MNIINDFVLLFNIYLFPGNIDSHAKQSLANGICCASSNQKYNTTKLFNKNNHSHDTDKTSFTKNGNNNVENFDNVLCNQPEITTATTKSKKCHHSSNQNNIKSKDRNKFCGSLPNHLDTDIDYEGSSDTNSSGESSLISIFTANICVFNNVPADTMKTSKKPIDIWGLCGVLLPLLPSNILT